MPGGCGDGGSRLHLFGVPMIATTGLESFRFATAVIIGACVRHLDRLSSDAMSADLDVLA
jgi:hypothetical protein